MTGKEETMAARSYRLMGFVVGVVAFVVGCTTMARAADYTDPLRLAELVAQKKVPYLLLDVRTPAEFASGHIPSAVNIPFDKVAERMPNVAKDSIVILYCASGARASMAAQTLADLGFTNIANFGAVSRWLGELVIANK